MFEGTFVKVHRILKNVEFDQENLLLEMHPMAIITQVSKSICVVMKALFLPTHKWKQFKYTREEIK